MNVTQSSRTQGLGLAVQWKMCCIVRNSQINGRIKV